MTRRFDLLVFDWDGTLADSESMIVGAMLEAIAALNLPPRSAQQVRELIGLGLNEALAALYPDLELEGLRRLYEDYRRRYLTTIPREPPLFPEVVPTLQALHAHGYRLAIATGKSRVGLNRSLRHHRELNELIIASRCADETASKPHPQMLHELLEEVDVPAPRALMIGDTEYDMAMAAALPMPALGVVCGVHPPERLLRTGAMALIEQVRHLPGWLCHHDT
jgi:phosphoglycolate phosphatase